MPLSISKRPSLSRSPVVCPVRIISRPEKKIAQLHDLQFCRTSSWGAQRSGLNLLRVLPGDMTLFRFILTERATVKSDSLNHCVGPICSELVILTSYRPDLSFVIINRIPRRAKQSYSEIGKKFEVGFFFDNILPKLRGLFFEVGSFIAIGCNFPFNQFLIDPFSLMTLVNLEIIPVK